MPSTYAHYIFGQKIYRNLTGNLKNIVGEHPQLYNIGLHGPDIFFYYKPLRNNPVNSLGFKMHNQPASDFFAKAAYILRDLRSDHALRNAGLAYILGFICHFALDSTCHGYIENKIRKTGITHTEIEAEFDRYLMIRDHLNPSTHHLADHIHPTRKNAQVIQSFFGQFSQHQIRKALSSMVWYSDLLAAPGAFKRQILYMVLKLSGNPLEICHRIMTREARPECQDSCLRLEKLMGKASVCCLSLIDSYIDFLYDDIPLDKYFVRTFGPEMNWQSIPVYSYQEELNYEI